MDAAAALFADRAIYMMSGGAVGRDEIREVEDWQAGLNNRLEFTDCKTEGNTVTCKGFRDGRLRESGRRTGCAP